MKNITKLIISTSFVFASFSVSYASPEDTNASLGFKNGTNIPLYVKVAQGGNGINTSSFNTMTKFNEQDFKGTNLFSWEEGNIAFNVYTCSKGQESKDGKFTCTTFKNIGYFAVRTDDYNFAYGGRKYSGYTSASSLSNGKYCIYNTRYDNKVNNANNVTVRLGAC
ncbi:hypothetical protein N8865_02620 [Francisellaceae bacterium]|nr:hypothetical protein [Francisellaceae bacterium]